MTAPKDVSHKITGHAIDHFMTNAPAVCRGGRIDMSRFNASKDPLHTKIRPTMERFLDHASKGGFIPYFADTKIPTGKRSLKGGTYTGGGFHSPVRVPQDRQTMYHMLLQMNPHQLEMFREIASQLLGGRPSQMWGPMAGGSFADKLEAPAEDYEHVIRMPNAHAMARMLEAENETGGGFAKALRHIGKIAHRVYKAGSHAVRWAGANKDLLMELVPNDYKAGASAALATASKWDNLVTPMVDVAANALKDNASKEDKQALLNLAGTSVETAIKKYKPELGEYVDQAKKVHSTVKQLKNSYHDSRKTGLLSNNPVS